jgi:hypothetical protein
VHLLSKGVDCRDPSVTVLVRVVAVSVAVTLVDPPVVSQIRLSALPDTPSGYRKPVTPSASAWPKEGLNGSTDCRRVAVL